MMMQINKMALACGLLLALGCGGESDDSGDNGGSGGNAPGKIDTGLPEEAPLDSVTAQQYSSACESLREEVGARLGPAVTTRGVCEVYGAAMENDPTACRSSADTCVSQINAGNSPIPGLSREQLDLTSFECGDVGELQGCSVTVGEFETCLEDQMTAFETAMSQNDCSNAASVDLIRALGVLSDIGTAPASCARVQQLCPGVGPFANLMAAP
jgi:hypothetical protein